MKQFIPFVRLALASVPDANSILANRNQNKKARNKSELFYFGGGGENRTRVRKSSTGGSTYLAE
jgi:hypothetical protein